MKLVRSLPPVIALATDELDVEALAAVTTAKPVQPHTQALLMAQLDMRHQATHDTIREAGMLRNMLIRKFE